MCAKGGWGQLLSATNKCFCDSQDLFGIFLRDEIKRIKKVTKKRFSGKKGKWNKKKPDLVDTMLGKFSNWASEDFSSSM